MNEYTDDEVREAFRRFGCVCPPSTKVVASELSGRMVYGMAHVDRCGILSIEQTVWESPWFIPYKRTNWRGATKAALR